MQPQQTPKIPRKYVWKTPEKRGRPQWTPERIRFLYHLKEAGFTQAKMAELIGTTTSAIQHRFYRDRHPLQRRTVLTFWDRNPDGIERVKDGWPTTESCQQIADDINSAVGMGEIPCTKNMVLGKGHRLGLGSKGFAKPAKRESRPAEKKTPKPKEATPKKCAPYRDPISTVLPLRVPLVNLEFTQCHYPVDETLYCGHPRMKGSLWCEGHRKECARSTSR